MKPPAPVVVDGEYQPVEDHILHDTVFDGTPLLSDAPWITLSASLPIDAASLDPDSNDTHA